MEKVENLNIRVVDNEFVILIDGISFTDQSKTNFQYEHEEFVTSNLDVLRKIVEANFQKMYIKA